MSAEPLLTSGWIIPLRWLLAVPSTKERSDLHYIEDGIHLNTDGRSEWTGTIKPYVDKEAARRDACK
jgi:hypothetical protein